LIGTWAEDLAEGMGFDLGEFMLHVLPVSIISFLFLAKVSESIKWTEKLTFGFMVLICSLVGVPRTLMISTNWSIPDSPGKRGCPNINSAITHPVDQMSEISTNP
jgi:hypothetical protein